MDGQVWERQIKTKENKVRSMKKNSLNIQI